MEKSNIETTVKGVETALSREELESQLTDLKETLQQEQSKASEFYDLNLYDLYKETRIHFMGNEDGIRLALQAEGKDYEKVKTNIQAAKDFEETHISPITDQILNLKRQIRILDNKKFEEEEQNRKQEALEKFKKEKSEFELMLYELHEKLYAQIPQVLKDSGIQDDKALEMHDPNLHYAAMQVQGYISQIDETTEYDFEKVKRYIESNLERSSTLKKYAQ